MQFDQFALPSVLQILKLPGSSRGAGLNKARPSGLQSKESPRLKPNERPLHKGKKLSAKTRFFLADFWRKDSDLNENNLQDNEKAYIKAAKLSTSKSVNFVSGLAE